MLAFMRSQALYICQPDPNSMDQVRFMGVNAAHLASGPYLQTWPIRLKTHQAHTKGLQLHRLEWSLSLGLRQIHAVGKLT